jgi:prephenate dehydrogenase
LLSTALAAHLEQSSDPEAVASVAGPGLLDMTRLALSSYEIWQDILATNADEIGAAILAIEDQLAALRHTVGGPSE